MLLISMVLFAVNLSTANKFELTSDYLIKSILFVNRFLIINSLENIILIFEEAFNKIFD
jgi:hypothetical protein